MKKTWFRKEFHLWLALLIWVGVLFSILYVVAQRYVTVGVTIVSNFTGSMKLQTGDLLYRNEKYYSSHSGVKLIISVNDSSNYSFNGNIVAPLQTFSESGPFSVLHTVLLNLWDWNKNISSVVIRNRTGFNEILNLWPENVFLDQTRPTKALLQSPISESEIFANTKFSRLASIDSGVWIKEYQYIISSDTWFSTVKWIWTTTQSNFILDTSVLAPGKYYWKVIASDYFGYRSTSLVESFVVDHPWNGGTQPPAGSSGPSSKWYTLYDNCPDGDFSASYYDGVCSASDRVNYEELHVLDGFHDFAIDYGKYGEELYLAYRYAYDNNITTVWPIDKAELFKPLVRKEYAKMVSQFAIYILWLEPTVNTGCVFSDVYDEADEFKYFMKISCELWLMWLEYDWIPAEEFWPNLPVSRAMFGTVLSRLLFGSVNNGNFDDWYGDHLIALKKANIMHMIDFPLTPELRGYAMLMLKRSDEYGYADVDAFRTSQWRRR